MSWVDKKCIWFGQVLEVCFVSVELWGKCLFLCLLVQPQASGRLNRMTGKNCPQVDVEIMEIVRHSVCLCCKGCCCCCFTINETIPISSLESWESVCPNLSCIVTLANTLVSMRTLCSYCHLLTTHCPVPGKYVCTHTHIHTPAVRWSWCNCW